MRGRRRCREALRWRSSRRSPACRQLPRRCDSAAAPADPVFTAKNAFIDQHKLVIVRLSDHWRLREPDPLAVGLAQAMGWTSTRCPAIRDATTCRR